ncbi:MAG TPA: hypothetical protein VMU11_02110 [Verrucomicrobiae bacterium]|nr:hypothetical protein [Verrucomicrobiae bacterium]
MTRDLGVLKTRERLRGYWSEQLTKGLALSVQLEIGDRIKRRVEQTVDAIPDDSIVLVSRLYDEVLPRTVLLMQDASAELIRKSHGSDPPPSPENVALKEALMLYERATNSAMEPPDVSRLIELALRPQDEFDDEDD